MINMNVKFSQANFLLIATLCFLSFSVPKVYALTDSDCMDCHGDTDFSTVHDGKTVSLYVNFDTFNKTKHGENGCISCHEDADVEGDEHPVPLARVNCGNCHEEIAEVYSQSSHGQAVERGDNLAPRCSDCHTRHAIFPATNAKSSTYPLTVPYTCGRCHQESSEMAETHDLDQHNIIYNYSMSIHGEGLFKDGLLVTAVCSSCHTAHNVRKSTDPLSSVNRSNIIKVCSQCHIGIVNQFKKSVHSPLVTKTDKRLPVCIDCHTAHTISRPQGQSFRDIISAECGNCHEHESETYVETYHGRASMLRGGEATAKCSDCHGSHFIQVESSPDSLINPKNILSTCQKCHPKATPGFTSYLPHANHKQKAKYPYLYYTFWAMTGLLVSTFSIFGIHTLCWLPRSVMERLQAMRNKIE